MNFGFTEEQELLRAEVRKFLDQNCSLARAREICAEEAGFSRPLWERMAELGWLGLRLPEDQGGVGLGWVDLVVVLEETGRSLFPSPLVATQLAAAAIERAGSPAQHQRWLPELASGRKIGTLALLERSDLLSPEGVSLEGKPEGPGFRLHGEKLFVLHAASADLLVTAFRTGAAPDAVSLAVVERDAPGLEVERLPTIDESVRMGRARFDGVRVAADALLAAPGDAWPVVEHLLLCGALAVSAEMVGAAEGVHALTVDYAKQRIQFDRPIAQFQGVKHPLAEAYADIESFKSLCYYAAWTLDESPEEAPLAVSRSKAYASEAFPRFAIDAIQLHGGIGYTWEYDAQLYLKRAKWARPVFGDADHHYARIARLGGL